VMLRCVDDGRHCERVGYGTDSVRACRETSDRLRHRAPSVGGGGGAEGVRPNVSDSGAKMSGIPLVSAEFGRNRQLEEGNQTPVGAL